MNLFERQQRLKGFGEEGQERLSRATVLIAGLGGLGCPVALYLAAAGIGGLVLADGDVVDASNLHRQILFGVNDIGKNKAITAAEKLSQRYPALQIRPVSRYLAPEGLEELLQPVDLLVDATDQFPVRYLLNDACRLAGKPLVQGTVSGYEGTCSVYHYPDSSLGFDYRHAYPRMPEPGEIPTCSEEGVLGVLPGIIGTMMAGEVIKIIARTGIVLSGKLLHYDLRSSSVYTVTLEKSSLKLPDSWRELAAFHGAAKAAATMACPPAVSHGNGSCYIDVREPHEIMPDDPIRGVNIPLAELDARQEEWATFSCITVYCQTGIRSRQAVRKIKSMRPDITVHHLEGGIAKWSTNQVID